jgi:hypothetical protein
MNRIYQGRVCGVEVLTGDSENRWQPLEADRKEAREKWQALLWQHHEMFQSNVNYLLAAFAALIPSDCEEDVWKDYRAAIERSWDSYTGRQGTWHRPFENPCLLVGCKKDASFREFQRGLNGLTSSRASETQKLDALKQLFESATETATRLTDPDQPVEESLKGKAKDLFGTTLVNLCAQKTKVTPRDVVAGQRNQASECAKKVNQGGHLNWTDVFFLQNG